ncbi:unnamed protein product [Prorocentrum cordatum]|uniref:Calcineurin-like phosphoesterase domain-containing protein n=1 Tax=Prorocentrum cordatum TaxID=2364126 RepID=A0ABN9PDA0_9DINO|nr:unnamed protein product [Polarella glacialis]
MARLPRGGRPCHTRAQGPAAARRGRAPPAGALRALACAVALAAATACEDGRFVPPAAPGTATDLNGVALSDVCFYGSGEHHVFVIGDWGGLESESGGPPMPADDRGPTKEHNRHFMAGIDNNAQMRVADAMRTRAPVSRPDFVINVGDSFYWGGLDTKCGTPPTEHVENSQWVNVFEKVYWGDGIDGRQWLGVLGNHDYGGWKFDSAWDQLIGYTWGKDLPGSQDRWVMPAQYYSVKVWYPYTDEQGLQVQFNVDYYFVDSNSFGAHEGGYGSNHNICDHKHNDKNASCGAEGPEDLEECPRWFRKLWTDQMQWLEQVLPQSEADWKILVTHYPPGHGVEDWKRLSDNFGIDLIVTGHEHSQQVYYNNTANFLAPTAWVVSGGGGGITSTGQPDARGDDDQYGFVDITLTKSEITVEMISHGGFTRRQVKIHKGGEGDFLPDLPSWKAAARTEEERKRNASAKAARKPAPGQKVERSGPRRAPPGRGCRPARGRDPAGARRARGEAGAAGRGRHGCGGQGRAPAAAGGGRQGGAPAAGCGARERQRRGSRRGLPEDVRARRARRGGRRVLQGPHPVAGQRLALPCPACYGCALADAGCRDREGSPMAATADPIRNETTELFA